MDGILDYLIYSYVWGFEDVSDQLEKQLIPNAQVMRDSIYREIDGKTFEARLIDYAEKGDYEAVRKVAETEMHRNYNEGVMDAAQKGGATTKIWHTMEDNKVRETHTYLDNIEIPIDENFYIDGVPAQAPGMFGIPEYDINCRCFISVK